MQSVADHAVETVPGCRAWLSWLRKLTPLPGCEKAQGANVPPIVPASPASRMTICGLQFQCARPQRYLLQLTGNQHPLYALICLC